MKTGTIYIAQGEEAVGNSHDTVISTILGSCISICLWDPERCIGGMNHLLLPDVKNDFSGLDTVGAIAMERLINRLVKMGAKRSRLQAKMFGGSSMLAGLTDIGARNTAFGRSYLTNENIPCVKESTGGSLARKIRFWPTTGTAQQKFVEEAPKLTEPIRIEANDVELF